jgi:hypothetical protein
MHIYSKSTGPVSPDATHSAQFAENADRVRLTPAAPALAVTDRSDKVQISDAGRALAAREADGKVGSFDSTRAEQIRSRVLYGAYDSLEVVDALARRLLESGDL